MKLLIVLNVVLLAVAIFHAHLGMSVLALYGLVTAVFCSIKKDHEAKGFHV